MKSKRKKSKVLSLRKGGFLGSDTADDVVKGGELEEVTTYSNPEMQLYSKSFDLLKSGAAYEGARNQSELGERDYKAFMNAEKNGYYYDRGYGANLVEEHLAVMKSHKGDPKTDFIFDEKYYPDYIKEALSKGMEIDYALWGPESLPVFFLKKPTAPQVKAKPKTIETKTPRLKIKKPVEDKIYSITHSQGGDTVQILTTEGKKTMSKKEFIDYYNQNKSKIQSYRKEREERRKASRRR